MRSGTELSQCLWIFPTYSYIGDVNSMAFSLKQLISKTQSVQNIVKVGKKSLRN